MELADGLYAMWIGQLTVESSGLVGGCSYKRSEAGAEATDENKSCSKKTKSARWTTVASMWLARWGIGLERLTLHGCGWKVDCTRLA